MAEPYPYAEAWFSLYPGLSMPNCKKEWHIALAILNNPAFESLSERTVFEVLYRILGKEFKCPDDEMRSLIQAKARRLAKEIFEKCQSDMSDHERWNWRNLAYT